MPYSRNEDLPPSVQGTLPPHPRTSSAPAFNNAWHLPSCLASWMRPPCFASPGER